MEQREEESNVRSLADFRERKKENAAKAQQGNADRAAISFGDIARRNRENAERVARERLEANKRIARQLKR